MLFHKTTRNDPKSLHTKVICPRVQLRFTVSNWIRKINILRQFNQCDDIWCSRNSTGLLRSWSHRSGHRLLHLSFVPACVCVSPPPSQSSHSSSSSLTSVPQDALDAVFGPPLVVLLLLLLDLILILLLVAFNPELPPHDAADGADCGRWRK